MTVSISHRIRVALLRLAATVLIPLARMLCLTNAQQNLSLTERRGLAARRLWQAANVAALEAGTFLVAKGLLLAPYLFKSDLGIPESSKVEGVDKFAQFMASLSTPLLIALAAVAPIALIFGAGALMMGNRRALAIIAGTVGALALAASATGLVN